MQKNISNEEVNLLRQNARSMVRELGLLNDAYFEIGVTLAERHLLIELNACASPTMGEIAEKLLLDKSTASRLINKAIKKGYIQFTTDLKDRRKKFIHLTDLGKKTLQAFEPIAFHQTKEALLTLSEEEITMVYKGIALYAQGLRTSRLQNKEFVQIAKKSEEEVLDLLTQQGLILKPYAQEDEESLYKIFQETVDSGNHFPYENSSIQEFYRQFLSPHSQVYVVDSPQKELIGGFYIKPNFAGKSKHIANAAYMIKHSHRGQGIGTFLVQASLEIAKKLGFLAMQFNMVLSGNLAAIKLYQKLGFNVIGKIPRGVRGSDGNYQDGYIFYRELDT